VDHVLPVTPQQVNSKAALTATFVAPSLRLSLNRLENERANTMSLKVCRDCGSHLELNSRGCPTCALNFEAEGMIDRFVLRLFVFVFAIVTIGIAVFFYLRRS